MKILFISEYFYPFAPGGAEWSIWYLAKALVKKGHKIGILTPNYGAKRYEIKEKVKIYRFPFPAKLSSGQHSVRYFYHLNPFFYLYQALWVIRILKKEGYQLIHAQSRFSLPGSVFAAKILKKPVFFYLRDTSSFCPIGMCTHHFYKNKIKNCDFRNYWEKCSKEYLQLYLKNPKGLKKIFHKLVFLYLFLDNRIQRLCLNHVNGITALSDGILEIYKKSKILGENIVTIKIPSLLPKIPTISLKEKNNLQKTLKINKKKPLILYIGKFSIGKGTPTLIKAIRVVLKKSKETEFLLIGKGKKPMIENKRVKIFSSISHEKILKIYKLASLVVVPSVNPEGLNRVIIEAMASGVCVISTFTGGTKELIENEKTGILVEPFDWQELSEKILFLLENEDLRKKLGRKGEEEIKKKLEKEKIIKNLTAFYTSFNARGR